MGNSINEKSEIRGIFWDGFLISIIGWMFSGVVSVILYSFIIFLLYRGKGNFTIILQMLLPLSIILLVFWLPISIISGVRSRKKGFRRTILLVVITILTTSCIVPFGVFMFLALAGAY